MIRISNRLRDFFRGRGEDIDPNVILDILEYNKPLIERILGCHFSFTLYRTPENYSFTLKFAFEFPNPNTNLIQTIDGSEFQFFPEILERSLKEVLDRLDYGEITLPTQQFARDRFIERNNNSQVNYRRDYRRSDYRRRDYRGFDIHDHETHHSINYENDNTFRNQAMGEFMHDEPEHHTFPVPEQEPSEKELTPEIDEDEAYTNRIGV